MELALDLLAAYGLAFLLMNEKVGFLSKFLYSIPLRVQGEEGNFFQRAFQCSFCTGFHSGFLVSLLEGSVYYSVRLPFASAAFCYGLDVILRYFEGPDPESNDDVVP